MRVEKVSLYNNVNFTKAQEKRPCLVSAFDSVSFTGKSQESSQKSFLEKVKGMFFSSHEPTLEEQKSEEIDAKIYSIQASKKNANKAAKTYTKLLKGYLALGRDNNWRSVSLGKTERLLFSDRNPDSLGQQTITRVDMADGMDVKETYDVHSLFGFSFTVNFKLDDKTDCSINAISERALSLSEVDKDTGVKRTLVPKLDGFYFVSGIPDENGEILNPDSEINYVFDNCDESYYKEKNPKGGTDTYKFNPVSDLWELQKEE